MRSPAFATGHVAVYMGDVREVLAELPEGSIDCVVTSPPYWGLRSYGTTPQVWGGDHDHAHEWGSVHPAGYRSGDVGAGHKQSPGTLHRERLTSEQCACGAWRGELGLEPDPFLYVAHIVEVFRAIRRVLTKTGTCWLNLGDSYVAQPLGSSRGADPKRYSSSRLTNPRRQEALAAAATANKPNRRPRYGTLKHKDLVGIPWRVAFALQDDGWWLRSDIVWSKPNGMPESVDDRPTKAHEYLFLLAKSARYHYDGAAIAEPLRSGASDLRKMAEGRDRIGGKTLTAGDPKYAANMATNAGRKRGVGDPDAARDALEALEVEAPSLELGIGNGSPAVKLAHSGNSVRRIAGQPHPDIARGSPEAIERDARGRMSTHLGSAIPWTETPGQGRNARSVWEITTTPYPEAHFATFPPELPRRCILAGCPTQVCERCGKPRVRILEREPSDWPERKAGGEPTRHGVDGAAAFGAGDFDGERARTVGFTDCGHDAYRPGVVLDPFAGSGTTLAVARDLGRHAVGIELHPDYLRFIEDRTRQEAFAL